MKKIEKIKNAKKIILLGVLIMVTIILIAFGGNKDFNLEFEQAIDKAELFVSQSRSMNEILRVEKTYNYEKDGAKVMILEVYLGADGMMSASSDYIKVWKNDSNSPIQVSWSSKEEIVKNKKLKS